jgi:DHA1 family bicyclomycin/chloramphenicol resistance-like MFS transporter
MRVISHGALTGFFVVASVMVVAARLELMSVWVFTLLCTCMMFSYGFMFANFTALAMEPQGHIAGTASSFYGSITTLLGIGIGYAIGQSFDGTLVPFTSSFLICTLISFAIVAVAERGRLFRASRRQLT